MALVIPVHGAPGHRLVKVHLKTVKVRADVYKRQSLSSQSGAAVTLEQARELVVNRAKGLTAEDVRIREDWDDGRLVYEGEAWCNNREHEFEIDAATGEFLSWSVENR